MTTPKNRIKKLEEKHAKNEPMTIIIDWDDTIEPKPGDIIINWDDDEDITVQKITGPEAKPGEEHKGE